MRSPELAAALDAIDGVEGWLSARQATDLFEAATTLGDGAQAVEIGSFRGRSAIVLARGLGGRGSVIAIDPHAGGDRGPQEIEAEQARGDADHERFEANLESAGVRDAVRHVRLPSQDALGAVDGELDLLFVDGAHRYGPARADIERWGARVRPGGVMLIHDSFSSIGVTLAILRLLAFGREFRFEGRTASLARYRRERQSGADRVRNAARQLAQLPWFARNVLIKVAVVLRLRDAEWPY
jgi:predicted O-methyltransferase YrrM